MKKQSRRESSGALRVVDPPRRMKQWLKHRGKRSKSSASRARRGSETVEMVKRIAGSAHDIEIHDMHQGHVSARAKQLGIKSVPSVLVDGKLADCCAGRGPDEQTLRQVI